MAVSQGIKSKYGFAKCYDAFYTGGHIQLAGRDSSRYIVCQCESVVKVVNLDTGLVVNSVGNVDDYDELTCFTTSPDERYILLAGNNLLIKQYELDGDISSSAKCVKTWKAAHSAPIQTMKFDATSTLLATASSDSTIKVWDIYKQYHTHSLKGSQSVISLIEYHPDANRLELYSSALDNKIRVWSLVKSECVSILEGHFSAITAIKFRSTPSLERMVSSSRDKCCIIWDITKTENISKLRVVTVFESVECLVLLDQERCSFLSSGCINGDDVVCILGGDSGVLKVWNLSSGKCLHKHVVSEGSGDGDALKTLTHLIARQSDDSLIVVNSQQHIYEYSLSMLTCNKQFAGYNDQVLALSYAGRSSQFLAVATNSDMIKLYDTSNMQCHLLSGHMDRVMCLSTLSHRRILLSGSKDNTVRVWQVDIGESGQAPSMVLSPSSTGLGHTKSVTGVGGANISKKLFVSVGEDCTMKFWKIGRRGAELTNVGTVVAHDKQINTLVWSPNDKLLATASMDKTAKVWQSDGGGLVGVCRGHKRGLWSAQFSSVDQVLATSSGDGSIKLWTLSDFTCIKTFEGHDCAVVCVSFVSRGMQLVSSATNGLIKLWTIKTNECEHTFDDVHTDEVWTFVVSDNEEEIISGGADSKLVFWTDVTEIEREEAIKKQETIILQEQELSNLLQQKKYTQAVTFAINLELPYSLLNIFKSILSDVDVDKDPISTGYNKLAESIKPLDMAQVDTLLRFSADWNTNSKHCFVAQNVINVILQTHSYTDLLKLPNIRANIEGLLPYSQRHLQRLNKLMQFTKFVDYTLYCMKPEKFHANHLGILQLDSGEQSQQNIGKSNTKSDAAGCSYFVDPKGSDKDVTDRNNVVSDED